MNNWDDVGGQTVEVFMTRNNWSVVYYAVINDLMNLITDRDEELDLDEKQEMHNELISIIRKVLPVLFYAVETPGEEDTEVTEENKMLLKEICRKAGIVIPEHFEDMAKKLVNNTMTINKENVCGN